MPIIRAQSIFKLISIAFIISLTIYCFYRSSSRSRLELQNHVDLGCELPGTGNVVPPLNLTLQPVTCEVNHGEKPCISFLKIGQVNDSTQGESTEVMDDKQKLRPKSPTNSLKKIGNKKAIYSSAELFFPSSFSFRDLVARHVTEFLPEFPSEPLVDSQPLGKESYPKSEPWMSLFPPEFFSFHPKHRPLTFVLQIIAWRRSASLIRLCESLKRASYFSFDVDIHFHIDANPSPHVLSFIESFVWDYGRLKVQRYDKPQGLIHIMMQAWKPSHAFEYSIFLEDDIEVSPYFFSWIICNMRTHLFDPVVLRNIEDLEDAKYYVASTLLRFLSDEVDGRLCGISLYCPKLDEIKYPAEGWSISQLLATTATFSSNEEPLKQDPTLKAVDSLIETSKQPASFLFQLPCSWGALYFPWWWQFLSEYTKRRLESSSDLLDIQVPSSRSNRWKNSWKKYFIEFMYVHGLYMIYPNLHKNKGFSTNHREPGLHTCNGPSGAYAEQGLHDSSDLALRKNHDRKFYVGLMQKDPMSKTRARHFGKLDNKLSHLPVINLYHEVVASRDQLLHPLPTQNEPIN